jgi:hypothetical protein
MLFGFTPKRLRQLAYQLAKANGISDRFNEEKRRQAKSGIACLCLAILNCH